MLLMAKKKYYAVARGYKTGIFMSWEECSKSVNGFPNQTYKGFDDREAAMKWLIETQIANNLPVDNNVEELFEKIDGLNLSEELHVSSDLPLAVENGMLKALGVNRLSEISVEMMERIKNDGEFYKTVGETDYHNKVLSYMLLYLPVNFYKLWHPLLRCARNGRLGKNVQVLELGPGPGTATMALMAFYAELAIANPDEQFKLRITAIEREKDFAALCKNLTSEYMKALKKIPNLHIEMLIIEGNAFKFMYYEERHKYDIIIESNMLNNNESIAEESLKIFVKGLHQNLAEGGIAIMIEPGTKEQVDVLEGLVEQARSESKITCLYGPEWLKQDNSKMFFLKKMIDLGLRCKKNYQHGFTYTVLEMVK